MKAPPRNLPASVRARLLAFSRERQEDFQLVLQRYAVERFLYRLGASQYRDRFVLKGAMLFVLWGQEAYRATRDLDLLGYGRGDPGSIADCFREICAMQVPDDGLRFLPETARAEEIRDAAEYGGVRVRLEARLEQARIVLQVDVGFGNAVVPAAEEVEYPTLLNGPTPRVWAYPREAVIAEKLHAMVILGEVNSRMKDFYDLFVFSRRFPFDGRVLGRAIVSTFERRRTALPQPVPASLSPTFFDDPARAGQWRAYLNRSGLDGAPSDFTAVGESLRNFLWPLMQALADGGESSLTWQPEGPWR